MADIVTQVMPWMAVGASALGLFAALAVLTSRSLFSASVGLAATCACVAVALAALGQGEGALALVLFGAGVAPVVLLGGVLLTNRAARPRKRGAPWLSVAAAAVAAVAMLWAAPSLGVSNAIAPPRGGSLLAVVALLFVAIAACVALLGYGERGVLGKGRDA